jgi:SAM-dependent methyltransferase
MTRMTEFSWPALGGVTPTWTGRGFDVGGRWCAVLDFAAGESAWSEGLTRFHEAAAGEGTHPIDVASRRRARAALKRHVRSDPARTVLLEAGCSSGFLLRDLLGDWPDSLVIGSDFIRGPLQRLAQQLPALPLLRFDLVECPLPSTSVDAVLLINVLEHIDQDAAAIGQVARVLKPRGVVVIEVPASPGLFDVYDQYLRHCRRYRRRDLVRMVCSAGLRVVEQTHLGFFVYPAFALVKRWNRRHLDVPTDVQRSVVERDIRTSGRSRILGWVLTLEEKLSPFIRYPVGIRCVVVAVKQ